MQFIKAGNRIIQVDHITDVVRDEKQQTIEIKFVSGEYFRLLQTDVAEAVWNWLVEQATDVMQPKKQPPPRPSSTSFFTG